MGERIALAHHERWDGGGYPNGIAGEDIPLEARICTVVDFFDALTVDRPYRKAVANDEVVAMMTDASGSHFDSDVRDVFLDAREEIEKVHVPVAVEHLAGLGGPILSSHASWKRTVARPPAAAVVPRRPGDLRIRLRHGAGADTLLGYLRQHPEDAGTRWLAAQLLQQFMQAGAMRFPR